jgi:ribosomal protein S4
MYHPSYKLNPGDMFQVDPEKVMFATGEKKGGAAPKAKASSEDSEDASSSEPVEAESEETAAEGEAETQAAAELDPDTTDKPEAEPADLKPTRKAIQALVAQAKEVLLEEKLNVSRKRQLRSFIKQVKPILAKASRPTASTADIATELNKMMGELNLAEPASAEAEAQQDDAPKSLEELLTPDEIKALERRIREEEENPVDPSKPYATPWRPRPFMSPFAFIPQYLEVNQNVCSAVYLRHPVARKGYAEVPTPFGTHINQLAFNWYLRRR